MERDVFADLNDFAPKSDAKNCDFRKKESPPEGDSPSRISSALAREIRERGLCRILPLRGRAWQAVCDAMVGAKLRSTVTPFFVANRVAKRWKLTPDQLCKGLDALEAAGLIETVEKRRGRYRRIRLACGKGPQTPEDYR